MLKKIQHGSTNYKENLEQMPEAINYILEIKMISFLLMFLSYLILNRFDVVHHSFELLFKALFYGGFLVFYISSLVKENIDKTRIILESLLQLILIHQVILSNEIYITLGLVLVMIIVIISPKKLN